MEDPRLSKYNNIKSLKNKTLEDIEKDSLDADISISESQSSMLANWVNLVKGKSQSTSSYVQNKEENSNEEYAPFIRKESRTTKIAKYFLAIGIEQSSAIMAELDDSDIVTITKEIAKIKFLYPEEKASIISEFNSIISEEQKKIKIKEDFAYEVLDKSLGKSKAKEIYKKVTGKDIFVPFNYLAQIEHEQLWSLLRNEDPRTLVIVYGYLNKDQKKFIFSMMEDSLKKSFVKELVKPKQLNTDTVESISNALKERIKFQGNIRTEKLDGSKILADILSYMDINEEKSLLDNLDMKSIDPAKDSEIREKIFDIDIILRIKDNDMHNILREFGNREIAMIIKDKSDEIRLKILSNVSKRRKDLILDDEATLSKIRKKEIKSMTTSFLSYIKSFSQKGEIIIYRKNEEFI